MMKEYLFTKNLSPKGAGNARNFAFQFCKGDYYAFCDSDDLWENNKLEKQINFMKKNKKILLIQIILLLMKLEES